MDRRPGGGGEFMAAGVVPIRPAGMELPRDAQHLPGAAAERSGTRSPIDLHVCPGCASELVYPTEWAPVDMCRWRVERRCPECEWHQIGLYEQEALDRFDEILDASTDAMVSDLRRLQHSNMEEELDRFNLALGSDLILPEDF